MVLQRREADKRPSLTIYLSQIRAAKEAKGKLDLTVTKLNTVKRIDSQTKTIQSS